MHSSFISNNNEIEIKLKTMDVVGISDDGWTKHYRDKSTGEEWLLKRYHSEYHGGGFPVLIKLPEPSTEQLIDMAITSSDKNEIACASLELSERERFNNEDFRALLISRLLNIASSELNSFDKERLKTIIYESNLSNSNNCREIVGKHDTEIESDYKYFKEIADKAKLILAQIEGQQTNKEHKAL